jgi:hypothetical protein
MNWTALADLYVRFVEDLPLEPGTKVIVQIIGWLLVVLAPFIVIGAVMARLERVTGGGRGRRRR